MPSNTTAKHRQPPPTVTFETSPTTNTTFVQADPSNFRAVVQKLTGSSSFSAAAAATSIEGPPPGADVGGVRLHERRQAMRKLEMIKLNGYNGNGPNSNGLAMASPVSTLDGLGRGFCSPTVSEEEERAIIAEKGFYLHPVSTPLSSTYRENEPKLLLLFPLHSPRHECDP